MRLPVKYVLLLVCAALFDIVGVLVSRPSTRGVELPYVLIVVAITIVLLVGGLTGRLWPVYALVALSLSTAIAQLLAWEPARVLAGVIELGATGFGLAFIVRRRQLAHPFHK
jgi:hypothetical protein